MTLDNTDRRTVLRGVAVVGAGAALTACGAKSAGTDASGGASAPKGTVIGKASDVPVGSGKIFTDQKIVVTQLTEGEFKAFSAVCTHSGCIVNSIDSTNIICPCHGSKFSLKDGSVQGGPAPAPLPAEKVTDLNGTLKLA